MKKVSIGLIAIFSALVVIALTAFRVVAGMSLVAITPILNWFFAGILMPLFLIAGVLGFILSPPQLPNMHWVFIGLGLFSGMVPQIIDFLQHLLLPTAEPEKKDAENA